MIFEEFKGTGNMELVLTRALGAANLPGDRHCKERYAQRRATSAEGDGICWKLRRNFSERDQAILLEEMIHDMLHTANNDEFMDIFSLSR